MLALIRLPIASLALGALMLLPMSGAHSDELPAPHRVVQEASGQVLDLLETNDGEDSGTQQVEQLLNILEPVIAFEEIARAVIGEHSDAVNEEQTQQFVRTFKNTMTRLYLDSMESFGVQQVSVVPPQSPLGSDADRARVTVEVLDQNGKRYEMEYFLGLNDTGNWKIRNIIVDGVNLGLTYRNQFDSAMSTYNNDPAEVISKWNQLVEE